MQSAETLSLFDDLVFTNEITVEAWVTSTEERSEILQALVSKWTPLSSFDTFDAYDASGIDDLDCTGYFGAVFDGRYVYFVPSQHQSLQTHGIVLRYDTHKDFRDSRSYKAYDASNTTGLDTRGYYGGVFDGRYVYFVPRQIDQSVYHSRLLRFDTEKKFKDPAAWDAHEIGPHHSSQSAVFDGRYIYFCPGYEDDAEVWERSPSSQVIRYDIQSDFKDSRSYEFYNLSRHPGKNAACFDGGAFDGRHVYFVPLQNGLVVRHDTRKDFSEDSSWESFDAQQVGMGSCVGAVFDGQYVYYVPYGDSVVVRHEPQSDFNALESWESFHADQIDGLNTKGFDGGFFDGRFVYFVPFVYGSKEDGYVFHSNYLRYDPQGSFTDRASWSAQDASKTSGLVSVGYNAGAFDGRFFYAAPWRHGAFDGNRFISRKDSPGVHGTILRYDTLGTRGTFSLRYCDYGHNGGLNAAVPGPSFLVNTEYGVLSVASHHPLRPGPHTLAGIYDGKTIKLFVDGKLVAQRRGTGRLQESEEPIVFGRIRKGLGYFRGIIEKVEIAKVARKDNEILNHGRCC